MQPERPSDTRPAAPPSGAGDDDVSMPQVGDLIAGKYEVVRIIGEGGMGVVYEAIHQRLRQRVAVKMVLPSMLAHDVLVSRFEREARAAAQLKSRHVARVSDVDVTPEGLPYMVMEYLVGHDLEFEIARRGRIPVDEAVDIVLQACAAMVEAHAVGIVHRDLKPSNLFLHDEGERHVVKVLDFGISKVTAEGDAKLTDVNAVMGTAMYMSPEQIRAAHSVDARTDIWALGVVLYEMLTGRAPWVGTPTQVAAAIVTDDPVDVRTLCTVPDAVAAVVQRALSRSADDRFPDVRELAFALAPFAPPQSAGRAFVDALAASFSAASARAPSSRSSLPARGSSDAVAAAVSEIGARPPAAAGPGGSSPLRAAILGVVVALVVGGGAIGAVLAVEGSRRGRARVEPTASATGEASVASAPLAAPVPPPPAAAQVAAAEPDGRPAASSASSAPRPHGPGIKPRTAASGQAAPRSPATATPGSTASGKPLFL